MTAVPKTRSGVGHSTVQPRTRHRKPVSPKTVDSKGRLALGKEFANQLVIVRELEDGDLQIVRAKAIPEREQWLYKNPKALKALLDGLEDARNGRFVEGPDMDAMDQLVKEMGI